MNVSCKSIGCDQKFKWPVQMYRQLKRCKFPPKILESKYQHKGEKFECKKCSKIFLHQSNVVRHVNTCRGLQEKELFKCSVCQKQFQYKSLLLKYESSHNHRVYDCKNCQKQFKHIDHYSKHELSCNTEDTHFCTNRSI